MKTLLLAAVLLGVITAVADAQTVGPASTINSTTDRSCDGKEASHHLHRARVLIRNGYDESRYPDKSPMTAKEKRALRTHKFCLLVADLRNKIEEYRDRIAAKYRRGLNSESSWCSPTPIASGGGCWEIPVGCVMSESGGSWGAANPSGAVGPYQLLGHGAPFPVSTYDQAMAHHRIAANLYAQYGLSPWVAPGC